MHGVGSDRGAWGRRHQGAPGVTEMVEGGERGRHAGGGGFLMYNIAVRPLTTRRREDGAFWRKSDRPRPNTPSDCAKGGDEQHTHEY